MERQCKTDQLGLSTKYAIKPCLKNLRQNNHLALQSIDLIKKLRILQFHLVVREI